MRIEHIKIVNYRQYQDIKFMFQKHGDYDLHLIIGSNGIGKTNLLNAITWCLYDEEPHLGIKSKALPIVNTDSFSKLSNGDICIVKVEICAQTEGRQITFNKEAIFRKTEEQESFCISTDFDVCLTFDNGSKIYQGEEAKRWVNRLVAHGIREFFFFDGEQLNDYFITDKQLRIEAPIYEISQVNLLNKIDGHLDTILSDFKREIGRSNPDLGKLLREQEGTKTNYSSIEVELRECRIQIATSDEIIRKHTEFLRGQEDVSDLENKKRIITDKLNELKIQKDEKLLEIKNFIREYTILILLYPNIKRTLQIIYDKESRGQLPPNIDKNYLKNMIIIKECLVCHNPLNNTGQKNIEKLLHELEMSSEVSHLLTRIKGPLEILSDKVLIFKKEKEKLMLGLGGLENREKELQKELSIIETKLSNCSDKDAIKNAVSERKDHEKLKEDNVRREGILLERRDKAKERLDEAEQLYNEAVEKSKGMDRLKNLKNFTETARSLTLELKNELMREMREKTREVMQDLFLKLIWKANTFEKVQLNDDYSLGLLHKDGYECLGSCSAAERALLALSFTLALHQVSGFQAPLVIDTPISRVSDTNRTNFSEVLKNVSKDKQLILLFTPSEYSDEIKNVFDDIYSSKSIIESFDERTTFVRGV